MADQNLEPILLRGVRILFRNFSGLPNRFRPEGGQRTFHVALDDNLARRLEKIGWHIKWLDPRDEDETGQAVLKVVVKYGGRGQPPRVVMVTGSKQTDLDESTISLLDWAEIINVDCIVRPWDYDIAGRQGIAAYLKTLYVTVNEDPLQQEYTDRLQNQTEDQVAGQEAPTE